MSRTKYTRRGRLARTVLHYGMPADSRVCHAVLRALGGYVPQGGEFLEFDVEHDDWCAALRGGACRCRPEAYVRTWLRPSTGAAS